MKNIILILTAAAFLIALGSTQAGETVSSGTFVGQNKHETTGSARIEQDDSGQYFVILGDNFSLDGAPDPKVGLGNDGFKSNTLLGKLEKKKGTQAYAIPAHLNPADFNEIWIWCERFSVGLGVASLK